MSKMNVFFNLSTPKGLIRARGEDAQDYLQSQLTINLIKLPNQGIRFGLRLDKRGKVLAGLYVLKYDSEDFLMLSRGISSTELTTLLEENVVADEVEFTDESAQWSLLTFGGPQVEDYLLGKGLLPDSSNRLVGKEGACCFEDSRLPGKTYLLLVRENDLQVMDLSDAKEIEWSEIELERIRNGIVAIPQEIGSKDLPQEGNLHMECVDFDKGCYLGQEVMARLHAMGRVRRNSQVVIWEGEKAPSLPCPLLQEKKRVGELKTLAWQGNLFLGIALVHENAIPQLESTGLSLEGDFIEKVRKA